MTNQNRLTCVHRASGTLAGATKLYEVIVDYLTDRFGYTDVPAWDELVQVDKAVFIQMFRETHRACKDAINKEAHNHG